MRYRTLSYLRRQVHGSSLVDSVSKLEALATLLDKPAASVQLNALFNTRTSGWRNCTAFHTACDFKNPTLVLVSATDGVAFGGYASISWTSNNVYLPDVMAFLFRISNYTSTFGVHARQQLQPEKFASSGSTQEVYHCANNGPTFGGGHDLLTFNSAGIQMTCNQSSYKTSGPLFTATLPAVHTAFGTHPKMHMHCGFGATSGGATEARCEMEVLQAQECLQRDVFDFDPADMGLQVKSINILLCGGVGAGKSSTVCTADSFCQRRNRTSRLACHGEGTGSLTKCLTKYTLINPETKQPVHWQLWDSMGWGATDYKRGEMGFILDGSVPNGCRLDLPISTKAKGFKMRPSPSDAVHCTCLVVPCDSATDDTYLERLREMRDFAHNNASGKQIPVLLFLTKIDSYDPGVIGADLKKTFHSERLLSLMEELTTSTGVPIKDMFPIKNFSKETQRTTEAGVLIFRALQEAQFAAEDYLRRCSLDDCQYHSADEELS